MFCLLIIRFELICVAAGDASPVVSTQFSSSSPSKGFVVSQPTKDSETQPLPSPASVSTAPSQLTVPLQAPTEPNHSAVHAFVESPKRSAEVKKAETPAGSGPQAMSN